jgi:hypothetical protein
MVKSKSSGFVYLKSLRVLRWNNSSTAFRSHISVGRFLPTPTDIKCWPGSKIFSAFFSL